jgi:hypothetical protein
MGEPSSVNLDAQLDEVFGLVNRGGAVVGIEVSG